MSLGRMLVLCGSGSTAPMKDVTSWAALNTIRGHERKRQVIQNYAEKRGMVIVRTYTNAGKSGLRIEGQHALKHLINDVENGPTDFSVILVYGVRIDRARLRPTPRRDRKEIPRLTD